MARVVIEWSGLDVPAPALRRHNVRKTLPKDRYDPGLDRIAAELDALPDPQLLTAAQAASEDAMLQRLQNRIDARRDHIAAASADAGHSRELRAGSAGMLVAIASTQNPAYGSASVRRGQELRALPLVDAAYSSGLISKAHVEQIRTSIGRIDDFEGLEEYLVDVAMAFEPGGLAAVLTDLILASLSEADAEKDYEKSQRKRGLSFTGDGAGGLFVRGRLDSAQAQVMLDAVAPGMAADTAADDTRTADQKRADILTDLIGRGMASTRPGGVSSVSILVDLAHLEDGLGATYEDGTPIPASAFEKLTDTALVFWVFGRRVDGVFLPLSVAREKRFATAPQWKALIARDRGCIRCGAKPRQCQAHHIIRWRDGGETAISNMCLLCSACHAALHNGEYVITMRDGIPHITETARRRAPP